MRSTTIVLASAALALVILASGCGGSGNAATGGGSGNSSAANRDDAQLKFARCLREHGVDVEEPKPGRTGAIGIRGKPGDEKKLDKAQKACQKLVPGGFKEPSQEEQEKMRDQALKFARCMRAHGIDVPDPSTSGRGVIMKVPRQSDKRKVEAAQKACEKLLPGPGPTDSGPSSTGAGS
jgi:hypothetical protein